MTNAGGSRHHDLHSECLQESAEGSRLCHPALPDPEHGPAVGPELPGHPTVPALVPLQLAAPERGVVSRGTVAPGAAVPEAAVHEDRHPLLWPGEVRPAREW